MTWVKIWYNRLKKWLFTVISNRPRLDYGASQQQKAKALGAVNDALTRR